MLVVLAAVFGAALGAVVATLLHRRRDAAVPDARTPVSPAANRPLGSSVRDAVDRLEIGVVMVDASGTVTYSNGAARAMHGTHAGLIVDDHVRQSIDLVRQGAAATREVVLQGPPKQILAIDAKPLPRGGAVATVQDVSARALVDAMRKDFVANISHELKTPVGAIAVLAEALSEETDADVTTTLANRLVDEAYRAVRTVDDLLELSRIESTRSANGHVDLMAVVEEAVARGRARAEGRDVEIAVLDAGGAVHVRGDRAQLVSALGNLVENAVTYSHDGAAVTVRARVDERWVELIVADEGVGIPVRDLDRVFERFYRVDRARTRDSGGTGLGLSIVRHVAQNHGGDVVVQSEEGEGSTFVIRLPSRLLIAEDADSDALAGDRVGDGGAADEPVARNEVDVP